MPATLRPFNFERTDYEKLVSIRNRVRPDYKLSVESSIRSDEVRPKKCHVSRYLLEVDGELIGSAEMRHSADTYHPDKYNIDIMLLPAFRGLGYGKQAYEQLLAEAIARNALSLEANLQESDERSLRFIQDRGFAEIMRSWESRLDPRTVDWSQWASYSERAQADGIELTTLAALAADPARNRKFYELVEPLEDDVPHTDVREPMSYETFEKVHMQDPKLDESLQFLALKDGEYIGYSALWPDSFNLQTMWTGLTGVARPYRKQGIASALKVFAIQEAQSRGVTKIHTWNEVNNRGMLVINERFGFVKQPAWLSFVKLLR